ncbi:flavodoxin domain-containing protein [Agrobacterium pusense]|uniref:flavodoxin domain-containing protein n=1 Tax=Agrobacterium pusense TaxID=648995 RepID=UPI003FD1CACF
MQNVVILYGTESGNAEMVADDIAATLEAAGIAGKVSSMEEFSVDELSQAQRVVLVTSTYGEGEMPDTAIAFYGALNEVRPDLSALSFAAFGLGDATYKTYNNAIDTLVSTVSDLGASQFGATGKHDAASGQPLTDTAVNWTKETFSIA